MATLLPADQGRKETVAVHVRLWQDVYQSLEEEARARKESMNSLINQLLSTYTRDEMLIDKSGKIVTSLDTIKAYLRYIPDDRLAEFSQDVVEFSAGLMLARRGEITLDSVLEEFRHQSNRGWFDLSLQKENGKNILTFFHELGPRHSVALEIIATRMFELASIRPKTRMTESTVTVIF